MVASAHQEGNGGSFIWKGSRAESEGRSFVGQVGLQGFTLQGELGFTKLPRKKNASLSNQIVMAAFVGSTHKP